MSCVSVVLVNDMSTLLIVTLYVVLFVHSLVVVSCKQRARTPMLVGISVMGILPVYVYISNLTGKIIKVAYCDDHNFHNPMDWWDCDGVYCQMRSAMLPAVLLIIVSMFMFFLSVLWRRRTVNEIRGQPYSRLEKAFLVPVELAGMAIAIIYMMSLFFWK